MKIVVAILVICFIVGTLCLLYAASKADDYAEEIRNSKEEK